MTIKVYIAFFLLLTLGLSCNKKCKDATTVSIATEMEEFFGQFKPGNWWVYESQNSSKRDSIYVTEFSSALNKDRTVCMSFEEKKFVLNHSFLLTYSAPLYVWFLADIGGSSINFSVSESLSGAPFPKFIHFKKDNVIKSFPESDNIGENKLDTIKLNGINYSNILKGKWSDNIYFFSKGKGLVGWIKGRDTFNLINYRIQ